MTHCDLETCNSRHNLAETWAVALSWIMNCVVNHGACTHRPLGSRQKPSRFIYVGSRDDFSDVRLILSHEIPSNALHVTLSHCWGRHGLQMKLTSSSEQDFKKLIPWQPLPDTFKDAIKVTRKLRSAFGVSYIWIDALCVIQDSVEDWQQESSAMGDTYRSSLCNLAACVGPDSYSGLFQDCDPFSSHTCVVRAAMGDSAQAFYEIENHETLHTDVESSYLESRAWVVQEILLAPRILYFTPHRLIWECGSLGASEKAPNEMLLGSPRKRHWFGGHALLTRTVNEQEHPDYWLYRIWMNTVNNYTGRNLTRSEDKLVAISGLAKQVHTSFAIPNEYVVGLWKRNLPLHMQWRVR